MVRLPSLQDGVKTSGLYNCSAESSASRQENVIHRATMKNNHVRPGLGTLAGGLRRTRARAPDAPPPRSDAEGQQGPPPNRAREPARGHITHWPGQDALKPTRPVGPARTPESQPTVNAHRLRATLLAEEPVAPPRRGKVPAGGGSGGAGASLPPALAPWARNTSAIDSGQVASGWLPRLGLQSSATHVCKGCGGTPARITTYVGALARRKASSWAIRPRSPDLVQLVPEQPLEHCAKNLCFRQTWEGLNDKARTT